MGPAGRERRWNSRLGLEVTEALQAHVYLQNMIHDVCALACVCVCVSVHTFKIKFSFPSFVSPRLNLLPPDPDGPTETDDLEVCFVCWFSRVWEEPRALHERGMHASTHSRV